MKEIVIYDLIRLDNKDYVILDKTRYKKKYRTYYVSPIVPIRLDKGMRIRFRSSDRVIDWLEVLIFNQWRVVFVNVKDNKYCNFHMYLVVDKFKLPVYVSNPLKYNLKTRYI